MGVKLYLQDRLCMLMSDSPLMIYFTSFNKGGSELSVQYRAFYKGAESRFELGPALQQSDAILSELRRTLTETESLITLLLNG